MEIKWKSSDVFHLSHLYRDAIHSSSVQLKFNGYLNQKKKKKGKKCLDQQQLCRHNTYRIAVHKMQALTDHLIDH